MLAEELFSSRPDLHEAFRVFLDASAGAAGETVAGVELQDASGAGMVGDGGGFIGKGGAELAPSDIALSGPGLPTASSSTNSSSSVIMEDESDQREDATFDSGVSKTLSARLQQWKSRPMSEIAAESTVTCTESYKRLPPDFVMPVCRGRTELERKTLNDTWVSVPMGSEDYSFKHFRKNQFEDNLFRCEDDRYELDMVIETNAAIIEKLEPISTMIGKLSSDEMKRHALADEALGPVHLRAIERIYGDHGADIIEQVKLNPSVAVPVVLARLKQKDEQWRRARLEMNKIWREVCEKNYYKSLDHRSFYFKQADKRELSAKNLVQEIHSGFGVRMSTPSGAGSDKAHGATDGGSATNGTASGVGGSGSNHAHVGGATAAASAGGNGSANHQTNPSLFGTASATMSRVIPYCMELPFSTPEMHEKMADLVDLILSYECSSVGEAARVSRDYRRLIRHIFHLNSPNFEETLKEKEVNAVEVAGLQRDNPRGYQRTRYGKPKPTGVSAFDGHRERLVLYGDEVLYILLRVQHIAHERLCAAWQMAVQKSKEEVERQRSNQLADNGLSGSKL